jgi:hypothetical protein
LKSKEENEKKKDKKKIRKRRVITVKNIYKFRGPKVKAKFFLSFVSL